MKTPNKEHEPCRPREAAEIDKALRDMERREAIYAALGVAGAVATVALVCAVVFALCWAL